MRAGLAGGQLVIAGCLHTSSAWMKVLLQHPARLSMHAQMILTDIHACTCQHQARALPDQCLSLEVAAGKQVMSVGLCDCSSAVTATHRADDEAKHPGLDAAGDDVIPRQGTACTVEDDVRRHIIHKVRQQHRRTNTCRQQQHSTQPHSVTTPPTLLGQSLSGPIVSLPLAATAAVSPEVSMLQRSHTALRRCRCTHS